MTESTLLDADSHVSEPLNLWQERLPAKYRAIAPHMETEYQGRPGAGGSSNKIASRTT